jgi:hypothetical protein
MSELRNAPSFGGKLNNPAYYTTLNSILSELRPMSSLRTIAHHLNAAGHRSPSGLTWTRERVANYLRSATLEPTEGGAH